MKAFDASIPISLEVQGLGPVPALKNSKRAILDSKTGHMRTLTEPKVKEWMRRCVQSFVSQLYSGILPIDVGTSTELQARSLIASSLPEDDCWTCLPQLSVTAVKCARGEDGATVTITRL